MQPELMRLFLDVAELGSISRVAAERGTAQSFVSRQISQLEKQCGAPVFHRNGRGVTLTELGQQILPRVRAWLAATDELGNEIKSSAGQITGRVRVGVLPSTAHPVATTLFKRSHDRYPGIKLQVMEGGPQLDMWLESGKVDIAVLFRYGSQPKKGEKPLATADTFLVAARGDKLTRAATVEFAKLAGLPLVLPARQSDLRDTVEDIARRKNMQLTVAVEGNSLSFQRGIAIEGYCHTLMGPYAIVNELKSGKLQASRIIKPRIRRTVTLVVSNHGPLTLAIKTVARLVEEIFIEFGDHWMDVTE
jgi:DNA-binding transcriptional LysR family regulator